MFRRKSLGIMKENNKSRLTGYFPECALSKDRYDEKVVQLS